MNQDKQLKTLLEELKEVNILSKKILDKVKEIQTLLSK